MSPKETPRTSGGGTSRLAEAFAPGRVAMIAVADHTPVPVVENAREVEIRLPSPEAGPPLDAALPATALLGAAGGSPLAARRRK
ncbi:DUF1049 domain-containing protein [Streptomyces sp. NPDC059695]|uniref:DUF1049 domain-containing protein n=1 Tax=Streptomyces sp. NPDC059695 TaxID=3346910 RepID=UPI003691DE11